MTPMQHVKSWYITHAMASELSEVESFTIDSMIREYYIYKDVWSCFVGKVL